MSNYKNAEFIEMLKNYSDLMFIRNENSKDTTYKRYCLIILTKETNSIGLDKINKFLNKYLVVIPQTTKKVHIRELLTGEEKEIEKIITIPRYCCLQIDDINFHTLQSLQIWANNLKSISNEEIALNIYVEEMNK